MRELSDPVEPVATKSLTAHTGFLVFDAELADRLDEQSERIARGDFWPVVIQVREREAIGLVGTSVFENEACQQRGLAHAPRPMNEQRRLFLEAEDPLEGSGRRLEGRSRR